MRFCLEASNQRSPKNIFQSRTHRAKAHIKSASVAKAILEEKERGSGPFLALFKPQISPQLRRNYCLFQTLRSTDREVRSLRWTLGRAHKQAHKHTPTKMQTSYPCAPSLTFHQLTIEKERRAFKISIWAHFSNNHQPRRACSQFQMISLK